MQIIPPVALALHGSGTRVFMHSEWASGQRYVRNESIVRYSGAGGVLGWNDYLCTVSHTSSVGNAPNVSSSYWLLRGSSAILSGTTPSTNVMLSSESTWVSGQAVTANTRRFDPSDMCDYVATIGISAGDNLTRPSAAVLSSDPLIASRWFKIGKANAWAFMDYEKDTILNGFNSSGTIVNTQFKVSVEAGYINKVALTGLANVKTITVKVYVDDSLVETKTATLTATNFSLLPQTAVIAITGLSTWLTPADIEITLTRNDSANPPKMKKLIIGYGYEVANTQWGVETGIISFSRKQRDPTYGTVYFQKRNSAKRLRAQCSIKPSSVTGDAVQRVLEMVEGTPVFWDFNNSDTSFDRCRIFGFSSEFSISPLTTTHEMLSISVEGLIGQ